MDPLTLAALAGIAYLAFGKKDKAPEREPVPSPEVVRMATQPDEPEPVIPSERAQAREPARSPDVMPPPPPAAPEPVVVPPTPAVQQAQAQAPQPVEEVVQDEHVPEHPVMPEEAQHEEAPPEPRPPSPAVQQAQQAPGEVIEEVATRSPADAARELSEYAVAVLAAGQGAKLGVKGSPSLVVRQAQEDMGPPKGEKGWKPDGIYGPVTRKRVAELGFPAPARK